MNKIIYHIYYIYIYIYNISLLEEKVWIQTFCKKSLYKFIAILSNSRQSISYNIIFTFNRQIYVGILAKFIDGRQSKLSNS